ncbi:Dipeptidyl peptidase family member 6 [Trichinella britovi]|uniref:Dipeptidyl peptidase family member 6 n=1 Tax=Trichinella britovi TaxID=45882 RepID=A0A0V1CKH1_TRIBR|nr:Dipeptidyl peptidase family member 6 [Trichinella britovi]
MRYREESGGQEHSYLSLCRFLSSISCFQSQLTYFPMYRLAEVEVAALYPRIREVTPNCRNGKSKILLCTFVNAVYASIVSLVFSRQLIPRADLLSHADYSGVSTDAQVRWIGHIVVQNRNCSLIVQKLPDQVDEPLRPGFEFKLFDAFEDYRWTLDGRGIVVQHQLLSEPDKQYRQLTMLDLQSPISASRSRKLCVFKAWRLQIVRFCYRDNLQQMLVFVNQRGRQLQDAYLVDLRNGDKRLLYKNDKYILLSFDFNCTLRLGLTENKNGMQEVYTKNASSAFQLHKAFTADTSVGSRLISIDKDGSTIYWISNEHEDKGSLVAEDAITGFQRVIQHPKRADISYVYIDFLTGEPLLAGEEYFYPEITYVHEKLAAHYSFLKERFPDATIYPLRISADFSRWYFTVVSDREPGTYYLYWNAGDQRRLLFLFYSNRKVRKYKMQPKRAVEVVTRDGLVQVCYLTCPADQFSTPYPLVADVHGGPHARNYWEFDSTVQLHVDRGYAILQCNFRGSTGYGKAFLRAGFGQWGGTMQNDVIDAIDWSVSAGIADPARLAISGVSYGGYAALMATVQTPDMFQCAVDSFGPSNLVTLYQSMPREWKPTKASYAIRLGATANTEAEMRWLFNRSPIAYKDRIKTPLLIIQGMDDLVVPVKESDQIVEALAGSGLTLIYAIFLDEAHGLHYVPNVLLQYSLVERFLQLYLHGESETVATIPKGCTAMLEAYPEWNTEIMGGEKVKCSLIFKEGDEVKGFIVKNVIGFGSFGQVYEVFNSADNQPAAMKVELTAQRNHTLKNELMILRKLRNANVRHICKIFTYGRVTEYSYIIMSLVGPNIRYLLKTTNANGAFNLRTVLHVGVLSLEALQDMHSAGYLHRDVKPENFAIGNEPNSRQLFILDFGMSRQFVNNEHVHRKPRAKCGFRGTLFYASANALKLCEQSRKDDIWSWFYMLIRMTTGNLPWCHKMPSKEMKLQKQARALSIVKNEVMGNASSFLAGCPTEFHNLLRHLKSMTYYDRPDYDFIYGQLNQIMKKNKLTDDMPLDWEQLRTN